MKRLLVPLLFVLCLLPALALASVRLDDQPRLTKTLLLSALKGTDYEDAVLYQPVDAENPRLDTSVHQAYTDSLYFPVVAVKGDRAFFLLLHRPVDPTKWYTLPWELDQVSETALHHPGFILTGFVTRAQKDERGFEIQFRFDFVREEGSPGVYSLYGTFNSRRLVPQFDQITVSPVSDPFFLYADHLCIRYDSLRCDYTYTYFLPEDDSVTLHYSLSLAESVPCDSWNCPDLSVLPLSIQDALIPRTVCAAENLFHGEILLRQFSSPWGPVLRVLAPGDTVLCQPSLAYGDWVLACVEGVLGYLPIGNIAAGE